MRSFKGHLTSLAITAGWLALLISVAGFTLYPRSPALCGFLLAPAASEEKDAPLSQEQTLKMLQAGVPIRQIEAFARKDGIDFKVTPRSSAICAKREPPRA